MLFRLGFVTKYTLLIKSTFVYLIGLSFLFFSSMNFVFEKYIFSDLLDYIVIYQQSLVYNVIQIFKSYFFFFSDPFTVKEFLMNWFIISICFFHDLFFNFSYGCRIFLCVRPSEAKLLNSVASVRCLILVCNGSFHISDFLLELDSTNFIPSRI